MTPEPVRRIDSLEELVGAIKMGEARCKMCDVPTPPHEGHRMHREYLDSGDALVWFECKGCNESQKVAAE